jgi:predicted nucleic acid-binding protein
MTFSQLVKGDNVFIDANIMTYAAQPNPNWGPACLQLLQCVENQELFAFTSTAVIAEVSHRMMIEASVLFGWPFAGISNQLRSHLAAACKLTRFRAAVEKLLQSNIQIITVTQPHLLAALAVSQQVGLLTNDALIVAIMQARGLSKIASNDADSDRVPGITRYAPA